MSNTQQEKPSSNKHTDVIKNTPDKVKNGHVASNPPPKPVKQAPPKK